jgi:ATP-binding cassette subfamily F protein uup
LQTRRKLSYNEGRELEQLPARIEALEAEQRELSGAVSHPDFYREPPETIRAKLARLEEIPEELLEVYARWHNLDSRA